MTPQTISHYRILSKLGSGGMGEVHLAEDLNLGRRVALKLLPARFTQDPERVRRFAQEARSASTLSHPNILTIYEIGRAGAEAGTEADGTHFIAMEYVEGQTLRQRMAVRRLALGEALDIAAQIASALVAAHGPGITHRDIKPENIMLRTDGYVKVLDFGLAKLTENNLLRSYDPSVTQAETLDAPGGDPPAGDLYATAPLGAGQPDTSPGVILGTVSYMSPEQARGLKVDARTDIFSLGMVLYEMVAGRPPFEASSTGDMLVAILDRQPPPLARFADIPDELEWIVSKAMAKDREDRYQLAKSLLSDLKRLQKRLEQGDPFGFEAGDWMQTQPMEGPPQTLSDWGRSSADSGRVADLPGDWPQQPRSPRALESLAVLPFGVGGAGGDQNLEYLSEAIPESLILNLSRLAQLRVKAWSTVARYRNRDADALEIGRELEADAVFTGRMFQIGGSLIIKAELVDTDDGSQIWGAQYQRPLDDLFAIEQELAREICEHLRLRLNEEERERLSRRYTDNAEAYQHYLKGRYHWHQRSGPGLRKAIENFNAAINLDADYALAYAGLADSFVLLSVYGAAPPRVIMPKAKEAALKALEIDGNLAEAHASLGAIHAWYDWEWEAAEREFKRAIELNPANANAYHWYGSIYLTAMCRFDEALEAELKAFELEPMAMVIRSNLAWICYQARRYDDAINYCRQTLEMEPGFVLANFYLGISYARQKRYAEAIDALRRAVEISGTGTLLKAGLASVYAESGNREAAEELLAELQSFPTNRDVSPFFLALIYAGLGDKERTLQMLEDTYEERYCWLVHIKSEPLFDGLRSEKRFLDLLERMGLA